MLLAKAASVALAGLLAATTTSTTTGAPPPAKAELLVDIDTGRALAALHDHTPLPPGSLTKVLTAMIAADWLKPGTPVTASAVDAAVYPDRIGMKPGQAWPYDVTMRALLIDSANDAAYALAEKVGGSLGGFAGIMQDAASQIGMSDHPVLEDPAGLDGSEGYDGGNRISAWDLALAARDMMANPYLAAIAGTRKFAFTGPDGVAYSIVNRNIAFLESYPGAIGVKTGYTDAAGTCIIAEAERGGRKMMAVVLDGANPDATAKALLDQGFATPVAAEPPNAPTLPAIAEPQRPLPRYHLPAGAGKLRTFEAAEAPVTHRGSGNGWQPLLAVPAILAAMAAGVLFARRGERRVSRRRRPGAGPTPR